MQLEDDDAKLFLKIVGNELLSHQKREDVYESKETKKSSIKS